MSDDIQEYEQELQDVLDEIEELVQQWKGDKSNKSEVSMWDFVFYIFFCLFVWFGLVWWGKGEGRGSVMMGDYDGFVAFVFFHFLFVFR